MIGAPSRPFFVVVNLNKFRFRTPHAVRDGARGTKALKKTRTAPRLLVFVKRSYVFAIHNAKTSEPGQEVLSERSELRNLRQFLHSFVVLNSNSFEFRTSRLAGTASRSP